MDEPYRFPRTLLRSRYGGAYEGGPWVALPCDSENVPPEVNGEDNDCQDWFANPTIAVGVGETPDKALAALEAAVDACPHPADRQMEVGGGTLCRFCDQLWGEPHPELTEELSGQLRGPEGQQ